MSMLYNRPTTPPAQVPGFTTAPTNVNSQTVPNFSAQGQPSLDTSPNLGTPTNPQSTSSFSNPSSSNFVPSNNPAANPGSNPAPNPSTGGVPPPGGADMLSTAPPAPSANESTMPSMAQYFNSSNPSTMMRTMVGNTTQSGAA